MSDEVRYTGAPDECNDHWPTRLVNGYCPVHDCAYSKENLEKLENESR